MNVLRTKEEVNKLASDEYLSVLHFMADWAPQCSQMNDVMLELAKQEEMKDVKFAAVVAEELPEMSQKYKIAAVPSVLLMRKGEVIDRVEGANAADLTSKVKEQVAIASELSSEGDDLLKQRDKHLKRLIESCECMLFMKGNPDNPKCGFSRAVIDLLDKYYANYGSFDILTDDSVRQGLKKYSNWPTFPQLYLHGTLIGGLDILNEFALAGELDSMLPKKEPINDRLHKMIHDANIMIFMKGNRDEPRCGFSRQLMEILHETGLEFKTFDILKDDEVRQTLKVYSKWPTYPQVYVKGELVGGLDIIKELEVDGILIETLRHDDKTNL